MMDANLPTAAEAVAARRLRAQALTEGLELSDFEYCQFAIVSKCHPGKALARVRRMRALQREFATDEVDEDAIMSYIAESVPGFVQSIGWDAGERGVLVVDFCRVRPDGAGLGGRVANCTWPRALPFWTLSPESISAPFGRARYWRPTAREAAGVTLVTPRRRRTSECIRIATQRR
jgi:hypothetical protein